MLMNKVESVMAQQVHNIPPVVLDAPTWITIPSQQDLAAFRLRAKRRQAASAALSWLAPLFAGVASAWVSWRVLASADDLINISLFFAWSVFATLSQVFYVRCIDKIHHSMRDQFVALSPISPDQAMRIVDWCSQSQDVDAYRLAVIVDAQRELCVGDYNAIAAFREADEDRLQHVSQVEVKRALHQIAARPSVVAGRPQHDTRSIAVAPHGD